MLFVLDRALPARLRLLRVARMLVEFGGLSIRLGRTVLVFNFLHEMILLFFVLHWWCVAQVLVYVVRFGRGGHLSSTLDHDGP